MIHVLTIYVAGAGELLRTSICKWSHETDKVILEVQA